MKLLLVTLLLVAACGESGVCQSDNCVCPTDDDCEHTCSEGTATCHVQGAPGRDVDVQCVASGDCHVECSQASSCRVDCGGSPDCNVTCPATGCTVTSCIDCDVSCGLGAGATHTGTTATCP